MVGGPLLEAKNNKIISSVLDVEKHSPFEGNGLDHNVSVTGENKKIVPTMCHVLICLV